MSIFSGRKFEESPMEAVAEEGAKLLNVTSRWMEENSDRVAGTAVLVLGTVLFSYLLMRGRRFIVFF